MKTCFKCSRRLPVSEFYAHPMMGDGHLGKCKDCTKMDSKLHNAERRKDAAWVEKERERGRLKAVRLGYSAKKKQKANENESYRKMLLAYHKAWSARYPYKKHAQCAGVRVKVPEGCNRHHWSYVQNDWEDVIVMKTADHATAHRFIIFDEERRQYRTRDGVLLDTRKAHEDYLRSFGVEIAAAAQAREQAVLL